MHDYRQEFEDIQRGIKDEIVQEITAMIKSRGTNKFSLKRPYLAGMTYLEDITIRNDGKLSIGKIYPFDGARGEIEAIIGLTVNDMIGLYENLIEEGALK